MELASLASALLFVEPDVAGDAFVALRGSWNRKPAPGYDLARIRFDANGRATRMETFVSGIMTRDGTGQHGRPCGVAVMRDGSILLSDDADGVIYRITYDGATGQAAPLARRPAQCWSRRRAAPTSRWRSPVRRPGRAARRDLRSARRSSPPTA